MNTFRDTSDNNRDEFTATDKAQSPHYNPPGLTALTYRLGTHSTFYQRLLERLRTQGISEKRPLGNLKTGDRNDPAIALLDAWAVVGDVLTFYQERIANEGYLRTATENRSILELSRTIGHRLNPGVAASTYLAFTVEEGTPEIKVPQGTKVQSIPSLPGERPQTFETTEEIQARVEWNSLKPYISQEKVAPKIGKNTTQLRLQGTNTQLQPGDAILLIDEKQSDRWYFLILQTVELRPQDGYTLIGWGKKLSDKKIQINNPQVFAFRQQASLFGYNASQWNELPTEIKRKYSTDVTSEEIINSTGVEVKKQDGSDFKTLLEKGDIITANQSRIVVEVSPDKKSILIDSSFLPDLKGARFIYSKGRTEWNNFSIQNQQIDLDTFYPKVLPGSWLILKQSQSDNLKLCKIKSVSAVFRSDFALSGKVTRIQPDLTNNGDQLSSFNLRQTTVFVQSEALDLFKSPSLVKGQTITIEQSISNLDLKPGQLLIFSGKRTANAEQKSTTFSELASIASIKKEDKTITLEKELEHEYDPTTLEIFANVALATHGETIENEVLGSGNGGQANQRFKLKKPPLTYLSPSESSLKVYVNDVLWQEVPSLHDQDARSQCYTVQLDDQGQCTITFGDGIHGSRLPSGQENVVATYRSGIGQEGKVKAGSLTLMQNRPLGIREVTNPVEATGAADPEKSDHLRENAPRTVRILDRIVSLRDFEDFTHSFPGIGKAQAVMLWTGEGKLVHITIAGVDGEKVEPNSLLLTNLHKAIIAAAGSSLQAVEIQSYEDLRFNLQAKVFVDPRYQTKIVETKVKKALSETFTFQKREFGQGVAASEVIDIIQSLEGVASVDLDSFYIDKQTQRLNSFLTAEPARWNGKEANPAQMLSLTTEVVNLTMIEL